MVSLLLVSAFFIHRPVLGLSPIHSLLYFIPVYLLGINCSINRLQFERLINGKLGILATLVVSLAILQSLYFNSSGSAYKESWFSLAEFDINLLQKVLMCFFFVGLLQQLETKSIPVLKHLANTSFAIYFLHTWVLHITDHYPIFDLFPAIPQVFIWLIMTCSVIIICMTIAFLIKKVMGNASRQLIGW
jgi:surface polysaccharide O-acyltransferase-like enzyme